MLEVSVKNIRIITYFNIVLWNDSHHTAEYVQILFSTTYGQVINPLRYLWTFIGVRRSVVNYYQTGQFSCPARTIMTSILDKNINAFVLFSIRTVVL